MFAATVADVEDDHKIWQSHGRSSNIGGTMCGRLCKDVWWHMSFTSALLSNTFWGYHIMKTCYWQKKKGIHLYCLLFNWLSCCSGCFNSLGKLFMAFIRSLLLISNFLVWGPFSTNLAVTVIHYQLVGSSGQASQQKVQKISKSFLYFLQLIIAS